jgi:spore coat polysaccharide biosynthesis protein SpsF
VELQKSGIIRHLGASVYEPAEALEALLDPRIQHLQIPFNVLDWRWKAAGFHEAIARRADIVVHARSALLQGILATPVERWPDISGFDSVECVRTLGELADEFERESVTDLCFAYVRSQSWIQSIVVGCETLAQLEDNSRLFQGPKLSPRQCEAVEGAFPPTPDDLLNPSKWPSREVAAQRN